ncbi:MAG: hypothetical protein QNJ94_04265 [Alphaproteobacteria bacterium]|nr:hypothetical protein [Alphaproteobacteria bacterium]
MISQMGTTNYRGFLSAIAHALKGPLGLAGDENPSERPAAQPPADRSTIAFEHRFFGMFPNGYFQASGQHGEPVFVIEAMGSEVQLPVSAIMREFDIAQDSPDGRMLEIVSEGLVFVTFLRLGDPVPEEILIDEPLRDITEWDQDLAYQRLLLVLRARARGERLSLARIADARVALGKADAFGDFEKVFFEALDELGCAYNAADGVIASLQTLAEDLHRIDRLRGRFREIQSIQNHLHQLLLRLGHKAEAQSFTASVAELMSLAVKSYRDTLRRVEVDMQGAITDLDPGASGVATTRRRVQDDLYRRLLAWDALVDGWSHVKSKPSLEAEILLRKTYSFLAQRFLEPGEAMGPSRAPEIADGRSKESIAVAA